MESTEGGIKETKTCVNVFYRKRMGGILFQLAIVKLGFDLKEVENKNYRASGDVRSFFHIDNEKP